jgi:hypothetical protein
VQQAVYRAIDPTLPFGAETVVRAASWGCHIITTAKGFIRLLNRNYNKRFKPRRNPLFCAAAKAVARVMGL